MTRGIRSEQVWGIGLTPAQGAAIPAALGSGYQLRNFTLDKLPKERDIARGNPIVVFIPKLAWEATPAATRKLLLDWDIPQRVLVLEEGQSVADFEEVLENGFLSAVAEPLTDKKVRDVIFRAKEVKSLYDDIFRMTREIMLERELLARKTDLILFLNRILTRASESLDPTVILDNAREDLELLLPIKSLMAVMWQPGENAGLEAELFLEADMEHGQEEEWTEYLLGHATNATSRRVAGYQVTYLGGLSPDKEAADLTLDPDGVIALPLRTAGQNFGLLAISRVKGRTMGKDQVQALHAAVNHLSLALKNAALFSQVKTRADHDGLTRIFNRRAFDERLVNEMKRHQRYRHPMSLLMLDIDHFKVINDTHGHLAGDGVLMEVGRILNESLRSTDFAARYGGEEFVVILPQTGEEPAWMLAERLRGKIAAKGFAFDGGDFSVTVSIGVATMTPGALSKRKELLQRADQALYQAKSRGRNMVYASALGPVAAAPTQAAQGAEGR